MKVLFLTFITVTFFLSCKNYKHSKTTVQAGENTASANGVKIIGTLLTIDNALLSSDTTNPCSKVPCKALIRIDEVTGRNNRMADENVVWFLCNS